MPPTPLARLLIVDDETAQMKALCNTLEPEGYSTTGFASPKAALEALRSQAFDMVLSDMMMPEMDGIALLHSAFEIDPTLVGVVMTGHGTIDSAVQAMQTGAIDYILKPFKLSAILPVISRALAVRRLRLENIQLQETLAIHTLSIAIAFASDLPTVLQQVADAAMSHSWVRGISVLMPSEGGESLFVAATRGDASGLLLGDHIPFGPAVSDWVERNRELLSCPDKLNGDHFSTVPLVGMPEVVSIPMLAGGTLVGILNFTSAYPKRPVSAGQVKALNILAGAAASALARVTLIERLCNAEQRYRRLAENAPDIVFRYDLHPKPGFVYLSPVVEAITGYAAEDYYADPDLVFKVVHADDRPLMETVLRGRYPDGNAVALRHVHRKGNLVWLEHRSSLVRDGSRAVAIEGIARDITERRDLEEQLRQSQKLEAIGLLAGGVAHDFNNLLTIISGCCELIILNDDPTPAVVEKVTHIRKAGEHATALTRQLLAFARKQQFQPKILDINTVVETTLKILRRIIGEDIQLIAKLQPRLGSVRVDPDQIEQILMNLAVNSRDAMPQGGILTIETRDVGPHVVMLISDTGCGMDAATQARVFEPFFTTKEPGKGTGLGLSIVYGSVKQSEGNIRIFSQPGQGTTFEISLPRFDERADVPEVASTPVGDLAGSETILVVEDNQDVRQLMSAVLRNTGYRVLDACDGPQALSVCLEHEGRIELVLTDMVLPGMSGTRLIEELRTLHPGIKVIYMSGYAHHPGLREGYHESAAPFLQKPFASTNLLGKVREVLDLRATCSA